MTVLTTTLAGCAAGGGRKGQSCRLDALLALLALLRQIHEERIPVQVISRFRRFFAYRHVNENGSKLLCASANSAEESASYNSYNQQLLRMPPREVSSIFLVRDDDEKNIYPELA